MLKLKVDDDVNLVGKRQLCLSRDDCVQALAIDRLNTCEDHDDCDDHDEHDDNDEHDQHDDHDDVKISDKGSQLPPDLQFF